MAYKLENLTANCRDALSESQQIEASENVNDAMQNIDVVDTRKSIAGNLV
jgi:hypothetical protein